MSQLLTLYITPVVYLDRIDRVLKRRPEPQLQEVEAHGRTDGSRGGVSISRASLAAETTAGVCDATQFGR